MKERLPHLHPVVYHVVIEVLFDAGQWWRCPKVLHKIKPRYPDGSKYKLGLAAYTLASAIGQSAYRKAVSTNEGWFEFSAETAEDDTGFIRKTQERHIAQLEELGLVERRRASKVLGKRELKIDYSLLAELIYEATQDDRLRQNDVTSQVSCDKLSQVDETNCRKSRACASKNKTKTKNPRADDASLANARSRHTCETPSVHSANRVNGSIANSKKSSATTPNPILNSNNVSSDLGLIDQSTLPFHQQCARKLWGALHEKGMMTPGSHSLKKWENAFKKFLTGVSYSEVTKILDFYISHLNLAANPFEWPGMPEALCADKFIRRFDDIKKAIERFKSRSPDEIPHVQSNGTVKRRKRVNNPDGSFTVIGDDDED